MGESVDGELARLDRPVRRDPTRAALVVPPQHLAGGLGTVVRVLIELAQRSQQIAPVRPAGKCGRSSRRAAAMDEGFG
jgi:hypothetical protein